MVETTEVPARANSLSAAAINYLHLDPDRVLTAFGKYGRYQMLAYFVTSSVQTLFALNMMIMPFITTSVEPTCNIPELQSTSFAPIPNDGCHVTDLLQNRTVACLAVEGASYSYDVDKYYSIASHYNLVCDKEGSADHSTSVFLLGGMFVSPFVTQSADLFGRRYTFLIPLYISVAANILCVFSNQYWVFILGRFISGVATTSFSVTGFTLCLESVSTKFRNLLPVVSTFAWVIGYVGAGLISMLVEDWRYRYFYASIPGLLTVPYFLFTPESLHWMVTKQDDTRIKKYINSAVAFNKQTICLHSCRSPSEDLVRRSGRTRTIFSLFIPKILVHVLINSFVLMVMSGTYWALSLYSTDLSDDGSMTGYFFSGLIEFPAGMFAVYMLITAKRKTVSFVSLFLTAVFMLLNVFVPLPGNWKMLFPLLAKSTNSIVWASQPILFSEATPTTIRNIFGGIVGFLGEFGSILAPYTNRLTAINKDAPAILISILSFVAAFLVTLQAETKDKKLPEDIDDFDAGPLFRGFRCAKEKNVVEEKKTNIELGEKKDEKVASESPEEAEKLLEKQPMHVI